MSEQKDRPKKKSNRSRYRALLWPVTVAAGAHLYTTPWQKGLGLLALTMAIGLFVRRRR